MTKHHGGADEMEDWVAHGGSGKSKSGPVMKVSREVSYNLAELAKKKLKHSEEEAMDYYTTTSTVGDDYICHRSHKYISRVWKNGKWQYYYAGDMKGSKSRFGAAARMVADDANLDRTARHVGVAIRNKMDKSGTTGRIRSAVSRLHDKYDNESAFKRTSRHLQEAAKTKLETSGATSTARNAKLKARDTADQVDDYARKRLKLDSGSAARSAVNNIASSARKKVKKVSSSASSTLRSAHDTIDKKVKKAQREYEKKHVHGYAGGTKKPKYKETKNKDGSTTIDFGNGVKGTFGSSSITKKKKK